MADGGFFEGMVLVLTGSDLIIMKQAMVRFPGRRGKADQTDFHLYPLSFREATILKHHTRYPEFIAWLKENTPDQARLPHLELLEWLAQEFNTYLIHGGFLPAINDLAKEGRILPSTLRIYAEWIRGDMIKHGRQEIYLREILGGIIKHLGSQITWNTFAKELSIDHPKTVSDYLDLLSSMDGVFIQAALREDKLQTAPKKVMFADPFVFHAIFRYLNPIETSSQNHILTMLKDPELSARLVEACVVTHYRRFYPTYYIKAEGEVDIAYIHQNKFWPVEVKWTRQIHPKDIKQIKKYRSGLILSARAEPSLIWDIPNLPLPLQLFYLRENM